MALGRWALLVVLLPMAVVAFAGAWAYLELRGSRGAAYQPWDPPSRAASSVAVAPREPCAAHSPLRQAFFGDLHVHTTFSYDSASRGVTVTPDAAYRFATGESVGLPPADENGEPTRRVRIERPLDFAAVTDHAEWLAETALCTAPGSPRYDHFLCRGYRRETFLGALGVMSFMAATRLGERRNAALCGEAGELCRAATLDRWRETQAAAEHWYDRSARCSFTTFHGYEHSRRDDSFMMHRNVLFRNEVVPELPISWVETRELEELWQGLDTQCNRAGGACEALAIPHNPNFSSGRAFALPHRDASPDVQRAYAELRAAFEPLVEMMQVKGESECRNALPGVVGGADELCDFEKVFPLEGESALPPCRDGEGGRCAGPLSFARYALAEGLAEQERIGVNPLALGFIGSTDTHNGTPGATEERGWEGSTGGQTATAAQRLSTASRFGMPSNVYRNPGGLAGLWAEENTRDALFDALRRREAFATSGTRIRPRLFAGPDIPDDFCEAANPAATGYASGVPMGGVVGANASGTPPRFAVHALRDPGTPQRPGAPLERIQIVKVWSEAAGRYGQAVFDVAGDAQTTATVDLATCERKGAGADALCAVWQDPTFDAARPAAYYARVLETPSCRWSQWECTQLPEAERPEVCSDTTIAKTIQERAWTSPIWYAPATSSTTR